MMLFGIAFSGAWAASDADLERACRPFHAGACSEAMGRWLPRVPGSTTEMLPTRTRVQDAIVDPDGPGPRVFLAARGVAGGTTFRYGGVMLGAKVVYDPLNHVAYYDEGCCSWERVVVAAGVGPPPKPVATRSLAGLQTRSGIHLGTTLRAVERIYGPAIPQRVSGHARFTTLRYGRPFSSNGTAKLDCTENHFFLFRNGALVGIDFTTAC